MARTTVAQVYALVKAQQIEIETLKAQVEKLAKASTRAQRKQAEPVQEENHTLYESFKDFFLACGDKAARTVPRFVTVKQDGKTYFRLATGNDKRAHVGGKVTGM